MKTIQPTKDYVFTVKTKVEQKSESGILLQTKTTGDSIAEVINVGSDVELVEPKDLIYYVQTPHSQNIKLDGKDYMMIHKDHILGIVKEVKE